MGLVNPMTPTNAQLMPSNLTNNVLDNTKSDQGVREQLESVRKMLYHRVLPLVIDTNVLFRRQLSHVGRPSSVGHVTGFEKFACSLD